MTAEDWAAHLGGDPADYADPVNEDRDDAEELGHSN